MVSYGPRRGSVIAFSGSYGSCADGKSVEFGGNAGGLGCADPLKDLQCLPQEDPGLRGVPGGQGPGRPASRKMPRACSMAWADVRGQRPELEQRPGRLYIAMLGVNVRFCRGVDCVSG